MNIQFLYCINLLLTARLILTFNDQGIKLKQFIIITVIQIAGLLLFTDFWIIFILALLIVTINSIFYLWEQRISGYIYEIRLVSFLSQVIIFSMFCAPWIGIHFNSYLINFLLDLGNYSLLLTFVDKINWMNTYLMLMGALLVLNESNLLIRSQFHLFRILPGSTNEDVGPKIDNREYNAGRIIGILERIIIYFAVLYNQFTVIGFLMAAKGFTRFKEMDNRNFAEYILIGTLLSTLMGIFVGILVKTLLQA